jgi:modulator of FtsH protease HflK
VSSLLLAPTEEGAIFRGYPQWWRYLKWTPLLWLLSGICLVQPDQQAVVTTFGAVTSPRLLPGLHYVTPWPIGRVYKVKVRQQRRAVVGAEVADQMLGRFDPASSEFLTGDKNLINIRLIVQYFVADPKTFLFTAQDVDREVIATIGSELTRRVARTTVDDILTTQKVAIQNDVLLHGQKTLDSYNAGVTLSSVNIDTVTPPGEAADAFREVAGARADAIRIVNEAQGYANDVIPRARGEASQLAQAAEAYRQGTTNRATGDADRFEEIALEYSKAPRVTATRTYVEAMEQILPKLKKLIVDSNQDIDLTLVGRDGSRTK